MRNILVPTDFSNDSFKIAEKAALVMKGAQVNIILFHAFEMPTSEIEMYQLTQHPPYLDLLSEDFRNACKQLKLQHNQVIRSIVFKHMYGDSKAVLRNFIDANDIDAIYLPDAYVFRKVHPLSVNPCSILKKSGIPVIKEQPSQKKMVEINAELVQKLSAEIKEEGIARGHLIENLSTNNIYASQK